MEFVAYFTHAIFNACFATNFAAFEPQEETMYLRAALLLLATLFPALSVNAQGYGTGHAMSKEFDAGPCMTKKEVQEKIDLLDKKGKNFMDEHGLRDLRALFFLNINPDTDIRVVLDALGEPEEEYFEKTQNGTYTRMLWHSSTGKTLQIRAHTRRLGDFPKIITAQYSSSNKNDEDELNKFRGNKKLLNEGRALYYEHMLAVRCMEALEKTRWMYEGKEMRSELAGWAGVRARFRAPNNILISYDPKKFARDDQILLRSFLYSHVGLDNDHTRMEKVKIWTVEETERRQQGTKNQSEN